jgi:signal peptidase I
VVELVLIVATALGLALAIQAFVVKPYRIPSGSMLPTIHLGQRVLVDRLGDDFSSPHIGEIIVFHPPKNYDLGCLDENEGQTGGAGQRPCGVARAEESGETFIKRVVGLPGDERARVPQRRTRKGSLHRALRRRSLMQLPRPHHGPKGRLLHDGRQPRRVR